MLHVRPAVPSDQKQILYFIDEAAEWLRTKGTDQWDSPWPNEKKRDARVERGLLAGRTWMVEDDSIPMATITCRPDANSELWSKSEQADPTVYISRLVVSRSYAGQGVGAELLNWAGMWAAQQYDAIWVRIDVWTTNFALHNYYEQLGFRFVRLCEKVEYPSAALFQKLTADIKGASTPRLNEQPDLIKPSQPTRLINPAASLMRVSGASIC